MNPDLKAALVGWSRRVMEDLGQRVLIDGIPALARFSVDEDEIKTTLDTEIAVGSIVARGRDTFRVTHVMDSVLKRARIERVATESRS